MVAGAQPGQDATPNLCPTSCCLPARHRADISSQTWNRSVIPFLARPGTRISRSCPAPPACRAIPLILIVVDDETFPGELPDRVQRLFRSPGARNTPLLLITEEARVSNLDFSAGITDFITRPYSPGQLETRLRSSPRTRGKTGCYTAGRPGHQPGSVRSPDRRRRACRPDAERIRAIEVPCCPPGPRVHPFGLA